MDSDDIFNRFDKISYDAGEADETEEMLFNESLGIDLGHFKHDRLMVKMKMAIERLKGREKEVLLLTMQGKSQRDIAAILGIDRLAVRTYINRAVKKLRGKLL